MMSLGRNNSIADMLYQSMEKLIDRGSSRQKAGEIKPLREPSRPFELRQRDLHPLLRHRSGVRIERGTAGSNSGSKATRVADAAEVMQRFGHHINRAARNVSLDPALIASVIMVESNGDPTAESPAGAKGLMQLADSTAADYGVNRVFDAGENIRAGSRYLRDLIERFGDLRLALAAYNAGPGNVVKYRGVPPFAETRSYVDKVLAAFQEVHTRTAVSEPKVRNTNVDKLATQ
jgi:soluble lytic murein transglycosylase-like protein